MRFVFVKYFNMVFSYSTRYPTTSPHGSGSITSYTPHWASRTNHKIVRSKCTKTGSLRSEVEITCGPVSAGN